MGYVSVLNSYNKKCRHALKFRRIFGGFSSMASAINPLNEAEMKNRPTSESSHLSKSTGDAVDSVQFILHSTKRVASYVPVDVLRKT